MKYDIVLAGVGGQGILTIAFMLDNAAIARGYRFKQAEVHGMSQRGGAVYSHLRVADKEVISDLIPLGKADMILSVEPLEVQRYLRFLAPDGMVVSNNQPFKNITDYPDDAQVIQGVLQLKKALLVDAKAIAAAAKNPRGQNMAMLGAATPYLPFDLEDFEPFIREAFESKGERIVQSNLDVLRMGFNCGQFVKNLLAAGVSVERANNILFEQDLATLDPDSAASFV
jgi:indolepyruvate ferredoxin oxidoreductase beta subunit